MPNTAPNTLFQNAKSLSRKVFSLPRKTLKKLFFLSRIRELEIFELMRKRDFATCVALGKWRVIAGAEAPFLEFFKIQKRKILKFSNSW